MHCSYQMDKYQFTDPQPYIFPLSNPRFHRSRLHAWKQQMANPDNLLQKCKIKLSDEPVKSNNPLSCTWNKANCYVNLGNFTLEGTVVTNKT